MSKANEIKGWASHWSQMSVRAAQDMAGSEEYDAQEEAEEALDAAIDAQQAEIDRLRSIDQSYRGLLLALENLYKSVKSN